MLAMQKKCVCSSGDDLAARKRNHTKRTIDVDQSERVVVRDDDAPLAVELGELRARPAVQRRVGRRVGRACACVCVWWVFCVLMTTRAHVWPGE